MNKEILSFCIKGSEAYLHFLVNEFGKWSPKKKINFPLPPHLVLPSD